MRTTIGLDGQWKFRQSGSDTWNAATVPGDIHIDLYKLGQIRDPYFSDHYKDCAWVVQKDWEFIRDFEVGTDFLRNDCIHLVINGNATFREVYLNGELLGKTDNMFLQYRYEVKGRLQTGINRVRVLLRSTLREMEQYPYQKYYSCFNLPRIFTRKAQCHFGWDWAPNMPGYGIWQSVSLEGESQYAIRDVRYRTTIDGNISFFTKLSYNVREDAYAPFAEADELAVYVAQEPGTAVDVTKDLRAKIHVKGKQNFINVKLDAPQLWYPSGWGSPHLYHWKIVLLRRGEELDSHSGRLGIREVRLVEEPLDVETMGFRFEINGKRVYIKGSNWVPAECFTGVIRDDTYRSLIALAREGDLNLLRVWGGGIYEKDIFYELCDENGIMVWQDMMFACADIPDDDDAFRKRAIEECAWQVRRLRNHPCIIYWCGGNEKTGTYKLMMKYGDQLVNYTMQGICNHLDGTRPYGRQSPCSFTDVGNDFNSGDSHANSMAAASESSPEKYREALAEIGTVFNSESAILGPARLRSIRRFIPADKLWPTNGLWEERFLKNPYDPNALTFLQREKFFAEGLFGPFDSLEEFLKKAMTAQGEILRSEAEYHRSKQWFSGGFLNWMFNDIWPTGTWSIIDYYCQPKAAYYMLKRAFRPIAPIFRQNADGRITLHLVNDTPEDIEGLLVYGEQTLDGRILWNRTRPGTLAQACQSALIGTPDVELSKRHDAYLFAEYTVNGEKMDTNYFHNLWRSTPWAEPGLLVEETDHTTGQDGLCCRTVRLTARESYARMVNLTLPPEINAYYSDNFFDMRKGETKEIVIRSTESFDIRSLAVAHWLTPWE